MVAVCDNGDVWSELPQINVPFRNALGHFSLSSEFNWPQRSMLRVPQRIVIKSHRFACDFNCG